MFTQLSRINLSSEHSFNILLDNKSLSQSGCLLQNIIKCRVPENGNNYSIVTYNKNSTKICILNVLSPILHKFLNSN